MPPRFSARSGMSSPKAPASSKRKSPADQFAYSHTSADASDNKPLARLGGGTSNAARQAGLADERNRARSYNPNPPRPAAKKRPGFGIPPVPTINERTRKGLPGKLIPSRGRP